MEFFPVAFAPPILFDKIPQILCPLSFEVYPLIGLSFFPNQSSSHTKKK